jgi:hypothetical protein
MAHRYAACTQGIPVHNIKASRCRTVPHGGFAAVQDDDRGWRSSRFGRCIHATVGPPAHFTACGEMAFASR